MGDVEGFMTSTRTESEPHFLLCAFLFFPSQVSLWVLLQDLLCGRFYKSEISGTGINNSGSESAPHFNTMPHTSVYDYFAFWFCRKLLWLSCSTSGSLSFLFILTSIRCYLPLRINLNSRLRAQFLWSQDKHKARPKVVFWLQYCDVNEWNNC